MLLLINAVIEQLKKNLIGLLKFLIIPASIMFIAFKLGKANNIEVSDLTRDTAAVLHGQPWAGLISMMGLFLWSSAATASLLSAAMLKRNEVTTTNGIRKVLFFGGCLSLFLGSYPHENIYNNN